MATFKIIFRDDEGMKATFFDEKDMGTYFGEVYKVSTSDYENLSNKPRINGVQLIGNKTTSDIGIDLTGAEWGRVSGDIDRQEDLMEKFQEQKSQVLSVQEIEKILYLD